MRDMKERSYNFAQLKGLTIERMSKGLTVINTPGIFMFQR